MKSYGKSQRSLAMAAMLAATLEAGMFHRGIAVNENGQAEFEKTAEDLARIKKARLKRERKAAKKATTS